MLKRLAAYSLLGILSLTAPAVLAEIAPEHARVEVLGPHDGQHWFWVWGNRAPSMIDGRALLFNDDGQMLGQLDTGFWFNNLLPSQSRNELFAVETYFSRGTRGERTDVVSVYDPLTLKPKREIAIPPKRINALGNTGLSVLSDDERFHVDTQLHPGAVDQHYRSGCRSVCRRGGNPRLRLNLPGRPARLLLDLRRRRFPSSAP